MILPSSRAVFRTARRSRYDFDAVPTERPSERVCARHTRTASIVRDPSVGNLHPSEIGSGTPSCRMTSPEEGRVRVMNIHGRNFRPVLGSVTVRPMVRCATGTVGRSGTSSWRLVDLVRRGAPPARPRLGRRRVPQANRQAVGSSARCQPSRHWCIRNLRALYAQLKQILDRVEPHGMGTAVVCPVLRSVTVRRIGARRRRRTRQRQRPCPCSALA